MADVGSHEVVLETDDKEERLPSVTSHGEASAAGHTASETSENKEYVTSVDVQIYPEPGIIKAAFDVPDDSSIIGSEDSAASVDVSYDSSRGINKEYAVSIHVDYGSSVERSKEFAASVDRHDNSAKAFTVSGGVQANSGKVGNAPSLVDDLAVEDNKELEYTLEDMQRLQTRFAEEAFNFLLQNAKIWVRDQEDIKTRYSHSDSCSNFTRNVGEAIITIAYIHRISYRKMFRWIISRINDAEEFERYIMAYPISKTDTYFFNFLAWVAFTFDFTIYCLREKKDFIEEGRHCLAKYPDLEYFHSRGGWGQLLELSSVIADMYDRLSIVINKELPTDDYLVPFMKSIEIMERDERYGRIKWNKGMRQLKQVRRQLCTKYDVIQTLDPWRVTGGYKVRMKKSPVKPKTLREICPAAAELMEKYSVKKSPEKLAIEELVQKIENTRIAVELTDRSPESEDEAKSETISRQKIETKDQNIKFLSSTQTDEIDEAKSVFIINERFLERRNAARKESPRSRKKRGLKIYSPSKQTGKLSMTLNDILEHNIEKKNYSKIADDVYAVCPPGCDIDDQSTRVIVLDTSSEEEDEGHLSVKQIAKVVLTIIKTGTPRLNENTQKKLKEQAMRDIESCCEVALRLPLHEQAEKDEKNCCVVSSRIAMQQGTKQQDVQSSNSVTSQPPVQDQQVAPKYTGAIPKIRVRPPPTENDSDD